ncbi:hypothetical protein RJT34_17799 [Clitoria ternatea]|uniref:Uncharacterized protein n=1 Tax=Clitoria ternatea TaxID=43366 RepID=A0AAN9J9L5_CLITE
MKNPKPFVVLFRWFLLRCDLISSNNSDPISSQSDDNRSGDGLGDSLKPQVKRETTEGGNLVVFQGSQGRVSHYLCELDVH